MFNTKYLSDYIYLAEAAYANFSKGYSVNNTQSAITDAEKPEQFANLVIQNYEVVTHYADRDKGWKEFTYFLNGESGFSATLFRGKQGGENAGKYVMAFKGTDGLKDLLSADVANIVSDGAAANQIIDMYNFMQQIKHANEKDADGNLNTYNAAFLDPNNTYNRPHPSQALAH